MDDLSRQYEQRITQYNKLVADSIQVPATFQSNLPKIRQLNAEIATILDKMVAQLAMVKKSDSNFIAQRDQLYKNLKRIHTESNALAQDKDTLETLRRIREFNETEATVSVNMYMIFFLILALIVLLALVFKGKGQTNDMTITTPSSPAAIPALA
jgi:predicted RND superfamily exporter protein